MKRIFTICFLLFTVSAFSQKFKQIEFTPQPNGNPSELKILNPITSLERSVKPHNSNLKGLNMPLSKSVKNFKVIAKDINGMALAIEGKSRIEDGNRNQTLEVRCKNYLRDLAPLMAITDNESEFSIVNVTEDENGNKHVRMQQVWNGYKVYGKEIILHTDQEEFNFMNGRYARKPHDLPSTPVVSDQQSTQICKNDLGQILESFDLGNIHVDGNQKELVYLSDNSGKYYLTYHHTIYKNMIERWEYFINAVNGEIVKKYPSICKFHNHKGSHSCTQTAESCESNTEVQSTNDAKKESTVLADGAVTANAQDLFNISRLINTYQVGNRFYMIDGSRPMFNLSGSSLPNDPVGSIWTIDAFNTSPQNNDFSYDHVSSTNNNWTNKISVSAHFNGGKAYEYFKNLHLRNSINGSGGNIISLINISDENGASMGNAFWNGQAMFYGNGDSSFKELARGLDVAGHEMTHGVVQNTANLEYEGESGALNESFADVFGAMIDREDWLIGEDVVKTSAFPSGALRSLSNPHNGASTGNFNAGWQPKKYSERYTGSEDNGGVHINSGIPNHAFFLFASNANVGLDKAEKVYYKALSEYLTKSSQFIDARIAVIKAAQELYGNAAATAAGQAFDAVEVFGGQGGNYEEDVNVNPGTEMILFTTDQQQGLYIYTPDATAIADPLSEKFVKSKPSISDDGSLIVFISNDNKINYVQIDWNALTLSEGVLNTGSTTWRSVAVSKDGTRLSALKSNEDNKITVFDLLTGFGKEYELFNPTFSSGINTGDVLYADVMDWDFSGEYIMYDAVNRIEGVNGEIEYWDIGFIKVWDNNTDDFENSESIEKLFSSLEEGITIGNPSFSKNSPYIIAFDYVEDGIFDFTNAVLAANIEAGDVGAIISDNTGLGYPSYSKNDNFLVYSQGDDFSSDISLRISGLDATKIQSNNNDDLYGNNLYWGVWFTNGVRNLTGLKDITKSSKEFAVVPNPASDKIQLLTEKLNSKIKGYTIINVLGQTIQKVNVDLNHESEIDVQHLKPGTYILQLNAADQSTYVSKFVKH